MKKRYFPISQAPLFLALLCILFAKVEKGFSQSPDDKNWSSSFGLPGVTSDISYHQAYQAGQGMVIVHDTLYIGTSITEFAQEILSGVYKWDGKKLIPFRGNGSPILSGYQSIILCIASDSNGRLIIGGSFKTADGTIVNNIAMWDKERWIALGSGFNSAITNITCTKTDIFAIGEFDSSGKLPVHHIARWDGNSWNDVGGGFQRNGTGVNVPEKIVCIDSFIYIEGVFSWPNKLQRWDGKQWVGLSNHFQRHTTLADPDSNANIYGLTSVNKDIYVCGLFDSVDGIYAPRLAKWDGSRWSRVGDYEIIPKIADYIPFIQNVGEKLYVFTADNFSYYSDFIANGDTLSHGAIWDGIKWSSPTNKIINYWGYLAGVQDTLFQLLPGGIYYNSSHALYSGFSIQTKNGVNAYSDSTQLGVNSQIYSIAKTGKRIYALLGNLAITGQLRADSIMIFENNKWSKTDFYDSVRHSIGGKINGLYANGDSLFIFGSFDHFGINQTSGLAMFDGKKWLTFNDPLHPNANISAITVDEKGRIYSDNLLMWTDTSWFALPKPMHLNYTFHNTNYGRITGGVDGIFVVAIFDSANITHSLLMHWDGTNWSTIIPENSIQIINGSDTSIGAIGYILYHNGRLIVNGIFSEIAGVKMNNIGYFDSTGWNAFGKGLALYGNFKFPCTYNPTISGIDFDGDKMYVTGGFSHADSTIVFSVAEWDGVKWNAFGSGLESTTHGDIEKACGCGNGIAIIDQTVYVGGNFVLAGSKPAHYFSSYSLPPKSSVHQTEIKGSENFLSIFPDPANNYMNVSLNSFNEKILKAEIIDELGNSVKSFDMKNHGAPMQFDIHDLHSGIYFLRLFSASGVVSQKFLIAK